LTDYGYDSFSKEEEEEMGVYEAEGETEGSWPDILSPEDSNGTPLIRLLQDYSWASWLHIELSALTASEYDERRDLLNLNFRSGVLLNGEPGNGASVIARSILCSLERDWISLNRIDWKNKNEKEFLDDMRRCLEANMESKLCLLVEDLSYCSYADTLISLLSEYTDVVEPQKFFMIILEDEWKVPAFFLEKLLICTFRNPDETERERYLKQNLYEPPLALATEEKKLILEKTAGFSYADMDRLIHWLRILQWDIFLEKYEESERDGMTEDEYSSAFGGCQLGMEQLEVLLGLLRKENPAERVAVPMVMMQQNPNPMMQMDSAVASELVQTSAADRKQNKTQEISAFMDRQSSTQKLQLIDTKYQAISNPLGNG